MTLNRRIRHLLAAMTAMSVVTATVTACDVPPVGGGAETTQIEESASGGVLSAMAMGPVSTWDPQRIASRTDAAFAGRVFARTLTAYQHGPDGASQVTLTGDLATDTGEPDRTLRVWTFTLREGVTWQDGSELTCEDVKYGISRSFATEVITGGPNYAVAYLDIPKEPTGESIYLGPYADEEPTAAGPAAFDKAVSCDGQVLTIRLAEPVADFPGMVSTLGFAAYHREADLGEASQYAVFSAGPYTLSEPWTPDRGGTFVRNPHWSAASDPIRLALPDEIVYREGRMPLAVAQLIMADEEGSEAMVALDTAPPVIQEQIAEVDSLRERSVNPVNGLVDYLAPNFRSPVMQHAQVRAAFALATDRGAYVAALGGPTAAEPTTSILSHGVRAVLPEAAQEPDPTGTATPEDETGSPTSPGATDAADETSETTGTETTDETGDPSPAPTATTDTATTDTASPEAPRSGSVLDTDVERAAELLAEAAEAHDLSTPVPLRVAYRSSPTMDEAMDALRVGWEAVGFEVELQPIDNGYFATVSAAEQAEMTDVFWSNWAADWNSASTVLPALFDLRLNISDAGSGRNYGYFEDEKVDAAMDAAMAIADNDDRDQAWFDIDTSLRSRGAYVALVERRSMFLAGSSVVNLTSHPALGGVLDLAVLAVEP